jgi:hypothetical protein
MTRPKNIEFEFEVDELCTILQVEATVTLPPPGHTHALDPDNDAECELTSVSISDWEIDPDAVKLMRKGVDEKVTYQLLTDLLIERAWEEAERV